MSTTTARPLTSRADLGLALLPLTGSIALALAGPGAYALDRIIARQRPIATTGPRTSDALAPAHRA